MISVVFVKCRSHCVKIEKVMTENLSQLNALVLSHLNMYFNLVSMQSLDCAQLSSFAPRVLSCAHHFQAPVTQAIMAGKY